MQRCTATIKLNGNSEHQVVKGNLTPAELVILEAIHGEGSVIDVRANNMDKTPHADEKKRLLATYPVAKEIIHNLYPGAKPSLPITLADAEITGEEDEGADEAPEATPAVKKSPRKRKTKAEKEAEAAEAVKAEAEKGSDFEITDTEDQAPSE